MIFRKNKPAGGAGQRGPAMRGRDSEPGKRGANALARRFLVDDEPETIDLAGPRAFPEEGAEPETRAAFETPEEPVGPARDALISQDPDTGKFYVHPGEAGQSVMLGGEKVSAPTELRRGDRIRIGDAEFEFLGIARDP